VLRGAANPENTRLLLVQDHGREVDLALVEGGISVATRSLVAPEGDAAAAVAAEVRNLLAAHRASSGQSCTVVVSGPSASSWRALLQEFGEGRDLAQYCDAWSLTETSAADAAPDDFWGAIALALGGLNWRGDYRLNLLPAELRPSRRRWRNAPLFALVALNAILLLGLAARGPLQRYLMLRRYDSEIARLERGAALVERQIRKEQRVEDRLATLRDFQQRGRRPLDALGEIAQKLPPDAWVGLYACRQGQVDISGTAKSASAVLPALKASPQFQDVQFAGGLTRDNDGGEHFHIQMKLKEMP
jgi:Tfp pilus assembly protein PilN